MENIIVKVFSEQGIIYGLFVLTFIIFIRKGIPYALRKFDIIIENFIAVNKEQLRIYTENLDSIATRYERTDKKVDEIKEQLMHCKLVQRLKYSEKKED